MALGIPLFAFDFDGVVCDSAPETGEAGWRAARCIWPEMPDLSDGLIDDFCRVRPVLHTGWQSILLVRLLVLGVTVEELVADTAGSLGEALMNESGLSKEGLVQAFGDGRDLWLAEDMDGWVARHEAYEGIADRIRGICSAGFEPVIITTKQQRFACRLLEAFGIALPTTRVFGLEAGPKSDVIQRLFVERRYACCLFVEDRLDTLLNPEIIGDSRIRRIFAEWGYCTKDHIAAARSHSKIESYSLSCFSDLLASYC